MPTLWNVDGCQIEPGRFLALVAKRIGGCNKGAGPASSSVNVNVWPSGVDDSSEHIATGCMSTHSRTLCQGISSITAAWAVQVREYFVKTGVFQILASHRNGSNASARPSASATTAAPAVSAGSPQAAPGRPSASSSPPQDPAQFAMRTHDHGGASGGRPSGDGSHGLRDSTLDSDAQRRLQLAAGAFRDPCKAASAHGGGGSAGTQSAFGAPKPGATGMAAVGGMSTAPPQGIQPLHALLHAIDVVQESDSPGNHAAAAAHDGGGTQAGGGGGMPPGSAGVMCSSGQLREATALLLSSGGGSDGGGTGGSAASLTAALAAANGTPGLPLPGQVMPDVQQMLAGALRAQVAAASPALWAYSGGAAVSGPPSVVPLPTGPASAGLDALALQHWWATAGGLPGAGAPAGEVLREVQNMFGDAQPAPKEDR